MPTSDHAAARSSFSAARATNRSGQALEAQNAEFSMNYIECESAIAAPLHLVPSHEEPAHTFKDVLVDATVCLRSRHVPCGEASRKAGCRKSARPVSSTHRRASGRCSDFASSHGARIQTSCSSSVVRIADIALGWLGSTVAAGDLMRTRAIQKKAPGFIGAFHLFAFFDDSLAARTVIVFLLDDGRLRRPAQPSPLLGDALNAGIAISK
jgi:hypothetical protein